MSARLSRLERFREHVAAQRRNLAIAAMHLEQMADGDLTDRDTNALRATLLDLLARTLDADDFVNALAATSEVQP